ncbi:hypothetical protein RAD16_05800 [Bradyrhizobium sp. 18BD]
MTMTDLPRKTSVTAFLLLYVAYCISYIDRAAISLALAQIGKDFNLQAADPIRDGDDATAMGGWVMTTFFAEREKYLLIGSSALTGIFLYAMYKAETIAMLIVFQSVVYFFKSFVLASVVALPTKLLRDDQIGSGVGMVNLGGQSAGFVAPAIMGFIVTGTGSFDAAFGFLVAMTALSVVVAATINTAQPRLAPKPA